MKFLCWLLMMILVVVVVAEGDVVVQDGGLADCRVERCCPWCPAIQFPFRLKGRQPIHCGLQGFDLSCSEDNHTLLEVSPSANFSVDEINYISHEIQGRAEIGTQNRVGCFPRELIDKNGSSPFEFVGRATVFSCPQSTVRERYSPAYGYCLARLSPCNWDTDPPGKQIDFLTTVYCLFSDLPLMSCTKVHDYTSESNPAADGLTLHWSIASCQHCQEKGQTCRLKINKLTHKIDQSGECFQVPKGPPRPTLKILGISALCLLVIAKGTKIYHDYHSAKTEQENQLRVERFLEDYRALKPSRYSYADIKRITNQFAEKLGQGAYGTVFKGKISSELLVAVKMLNNSNGNGDDFINEVGTMCQIYHVNVVRLVGFCADGFIRALVYEFLPNGPLQSFLSSADNKTPIFLGWDKLQDIALGIAKGIDYLHQGCDQRILHFDIKPHNVLLDQDFIPKVSDFGLAKLCSKDQSAISLTTARGTMGYIAPEVFSRNFGNVSYKSDVYSFGTLLLEMVGGRKNFKVMEDCTSQVYFPEWIYNLLQQGDDLRIHIGDDEGDATIARKLAIVGLWCIQWHPIDRPSMKLAVQMLEREGDSSLTMPPNPFASTSSSTGGK